MHVFPTFVFPKFNTLPENEQWKPDSNAFSKALLDLLFSNLTFSGMPKMYDCIGYNESVMAQILALTETLHGVVNYKFCIAH
jgi:hypothetical protein